MIRLRNALRRESDGEAGLSLVEVVVAMLVFTIISTGLLYTMVLLLGTTRDSRARQVATNLAAQEIDRARDVSDIFDIDDVPRTVSLNGDTFHVLRTQEWVNNDGVSEACGTGGDTLRYKRVQVDVTWDGMRVGSKAVRTDTLINPNERLSDPELGTILVSVQTAGGEGVPGVAISAVAGSITLSTTTDAKGCGFLLKVAPAQYTVTIQRAGYVDVAGNDKPNQVAQVEKGSAASNIFSFDQAGTFKVTYGSASTKIPLNMSTTLLSTRDPAVYPSTADTNPRSFAVYPWADGYGVITGNPAVCKAYDPSLWTAFGPKGQGVRPDPVAAASGATTNITVPMSTVNVSGLDASTRFITAVSVSSPGSGQPDCATVQTLRFSALGANSGTIALPPGTWSIHKGNSTTYTPTTVNKVTGGGIVGALFSVITSNNVVADPRPAS